MWLSGCGDSTCSCESKLTRRLSTLTRVCGSEDRGPRLLGACRKGGSCVLCGAWNGSQHKNNKKQRKKKKKKKKKNPGREDGAVVPAELQQKKNPPRPLARSCRQGCQCRILRLHRAPAFAHPRACVYLAATPTSREKKRRWGEERGSL